MTNDYWIKIKNWNEQNKTWFWGGIGGVIITIVATIIIALIPSKNEDKQGVSIGGDVVVSGDSAITGSGNININKEVSNTSDRIVSIQKRLTNLQSQDPVINYLIQKAKDAFYANKLDEAEKLLQRHIPQRSKTTDAYCKGGFGRKTRQGYCFAMAPDTLVPRHAHGCKAGDIK